MLLLNLMRKTRKARLNGVIVLMLMSQVLYAQDPLEQYIQEGLNNNLVLKSRKVSLEKSLLALKEARSLFLPTSYFDGQYTLAQGGRAISIPVGDLLNPVYETLNQITGTDKFPTISNVDEQLLPNNFYDIRLKTTMPIVNNELKANRNIKQKETAIKENELIIYKRELIKEIKTAYYQYLMADRAISIYDNALVVVRQNLRVNQSMLQNGKGLPAYVSRAESEVTSVETQLQNAKNEKQKARAYFNSLLNRELSDSVSIIELQTEKAMADAIQSNFDSIEGREELKSLQISKGIQGDLLKMNKSFRVPKVNAYLDLAAQNFNFLVDDHSFFYLGGVQAIFPIFSGNRNLYKIQQNEYDIKQVDLTTSNTRRQLELAAFNSKSNARNLYGNYSASLKTEESSTLYFKLIDRGYKEGVNTFIELLDARNQLTQSQLQVALNKYRFLASLADYERQTSSYTLK
jgi:outer membrane protein